MSEPLPVPPELQHLIEKREAEEDRRLRERRAGDDQRALDAGPLGAIESAESLDDVPLEDRRSARNVADRRTGASSSSASPTGSCPATESPGHSSRRVLTPGRTSGSSRRGQTARRPAGAPVPAASQPIRRPSARRRAPRRPAPRDPAPGW